MKLHLDRREVWADQVPDELKPLAFVVMFPVNSLYCCSSKLGGDVIIKLDALAKCLRQQDYAGVDAEELSHGGGISLGV